MISSTISRRAANAPLLASKPSSISSSTRLFSASAVAASHIGSTPITVPEGVEVTIVPKKIDSLTRMKMDIASKRRGKFPINLTQEAIVKGPLGESRLDIAEFVNVDINKENSETTITVAVQDSKHKPQRQMWGTTRSLLNNTIAGVSEGHISILKFVGTGFRAALEKNEEGKEYISLKVGYCVPIPVEIPEGITVKLPLPHRMIIEGTDKQAVKLLAASIRKHRQPEPYKGKGIFVDGETIKLKARKIK